MWVQTRSAKMALMPVEACAYMHISNAHLLRARVWWEHVEWNAHLLHKKVLKILNDKDIKGSLGEHFRGSRKRKKSTALLREPIEPYCLASVVHRAYLESFADGRPLAKQTR